jgi:hypothetical protein
MTAQNSFWAALRESMLELIFGRYQLEAMRREKIAREECERVCEKHRRAAELAR